MNKLTVVAAKSSSAAFSDGIRGSGTFSISRVLIMIFGGVIVVTLVIVTSDNGADKGFYKPIRDKKASIYEGGHRVPFMIRWPGVIQAGTICDLVVMQDAGIQPIRLHNQPG